MKNQPTKAEVISALMQGHSPAKAAEILGIKYPDMQHCLRVYNISEECYNQFDENRELPIVNRQGLFDAVAAIIKTGKLRCVRELTDREGNRNIVVTFGNGFCMYVNEDNSVLIRAQGSIDMLGGISRESLIALTEEGKEAARKKAEEKKKHSVEQWEAQKKILEDKIRQAQENDTMAVERDTNATTTNERPKGLWQKIFSTKDKP